MQGQYVKTVQAHQQALTVMGRAESVERHKLPPDSAGVHAASRQQAERSSISGCAATTLTSFSSKKFFSRQSIWQLSVSTLLEGTLLTSLSATTLRMTGLSRRLKPGGCSSSSLLESTSAIRCPVLPPSGLGSVSTQFLSFIIMQASCKQGSGLRVCCMAS